MNGIAEWLLPHLGGIASAAQWKAFDPTPALRAMLDHAAMQTLERIAPSHFTTPLGNAIAIDYDGDAPTVELRLQELFGVTAHPVVAGRALRLILLSPARRPVQTTMDLLGFWATSYGDVRRDMRARYPRHPWPQDPTDAAPTLRARPRKR